MMRTTAWIALAALTSLSLAACGRPTGTAPAGSDTAAAMPDTSQPRDPNAAMTAPDAGATGAVPPSPEQAAPAPAEQPK
jgi:predicted small secreted protein